MLAPVLARADAGLDLDWSAPDGCPDAKAAEHMLAEYLGPRALQTSVKPAQYSVEITRAAAARFRARVREAMSGERVFEGSDCVVVAQAAALIVAMTFDPLATTTNLTRGSQPALPHLWSLSGGLSADIGSLPEPSLALTLGVAIQAGRLYGALHATAWLGQEVLREAEVGGAYVSLFAGALRGCVNTLESTSSGLELAPCATFELGTAIGRGVGVHNPQTSAGFWATPLLGVSVRQRSQGGLQSSFSIDGGVPVLRPQFVILRVRLRRLSRGST
jgi:hypothetical protein